MNRPQDVLPELQQETWETELEDAFFDDPLPQDDTLDPPPVRDLSAHEPAPETLFAVPIAIDVPDSAPPIDDAAIVVHVTPGWVWPAVVGSALVAVGSVAFGVGVLWATSAAPVVTPSAASPSMPEAPAEVEASAPVAAPPVRPPPAKKRPARKAPRRTRARAPAAEPPAAPPSAAKAIAPAPPVVSAAAKPAGSPQPEAGTAPLRPGDLPKAVSLGQLAPGAPL